jgi:hemerythrin-like domain-containing protein
MEESAKGYLLSGLPDTLVADIKSYIDHVALHLAKENHWLFMMADMILQNKTDQVRGDLSQRGSKVERARQDKEPLRKACKRSRIGIAVRF